MRPLDDKELCRKSETKVSLPNEQSYPGRMAKTAVARSGASNPADKSTEKNFAHFMPRNPLISLDSDERIQGNTRQSNPHELGSSQRNGHKPRKAKRIDRTNVEARRREARNANTGGLDERRVASARSHVQVRDA
jgi:hypothetical protein